jgi:hypothetical protein
MTSTIKFYRLALGAKFVFHGRAYTKIAMSMANDDQRLGTCFMGSAEVLTDDPALLLSPEEAARWKPPEGHWYDHMSRAPGPK